MSISEKLAEDASSLRKRIDKLEQWKAAINVHWERQHELNPQTEERMKALEIDSTKFKSGWFTTCFIAGAVSSVSLLLIAVITLLYVIFR